ncbi:hypothetical protein [Desulfobulbus alkaliphilus]|uniref:hypothetical protein n=1 Tax=Desulfobulbus alkaliphilus TaxID=869814 RepID=UPI001966236C|nr:hypothetical protein [Desulfobulbus alkaliphilus]MBM9537869.1 hypothetical protein [Desulfobulbus alkaliphilus]
MEKVWSTHRPGWLRWLDIALRTGHIAAAALLFGGFFFHIPFAQLQVWHHLTITTGVGLVVLELVQDRNWIHQGKGLVTLVHIGLAGSIHFRPDLVMPLLWAMLVTGSIGSHMPRRFRHWSILYGKEVREERR